MTPLDKLSRRAFLEQSAKVAATGLAGSYVTSLSASASGQSTDGPWQIGCYTRPWDKYDYRVALDAIAEAGFKYAGLMTTSSKTHLVISVDTTLEEAQQVREEVKKRNLQVLSVYGGDIAAAKSLKAGIEDLKKLLDNCAACGAKNLLMGGTGDKQVYEAYYKAIAECCDYAAEKGIGISIKPHGGLNATGPQCRKAVELVDHKSFRIWYDPGNILYYSDGQLDPVADAATVDGLVTGMCVKDYRHPKNVAVTPGTGQVDFPAVLARLKKGGFTGGPLIVECLEPGDAEKTLGEAKKARLFLENVVGQKPQTAAAGRPTAELRAGVAVIDITPPIGYRMSGYFYERLSTAVMNPLHAKAIVLRQQDQSAAVVFCDLIGLSREVTSRARKEASEKTGIPPENILIAATHSHTGPLYFGALRKHFHDVAVAKYGSDPCEKVDYANVLAGKIAQVIAQADAGTEPVRLQAAVARQQGLSFNRRFHMKDGTVRFNPGVLNPDIVRAAGPIDPGVGMVFFRGIDGDNAIAAMLNFALHLDTTGGTEYAADYPYYVEQSLRQSFGEDFVLLFGTGTCGDINHIDVTKKDRLKTDYIGRTLAETVRAKVADPRFRGDTAPMLAVRREIVNAPLQHYSPEKIAWARENIKKVGTSELSFLEQVEAYKILAIEMRGGQTIPLEVQVFRLSPEVAVVGLPGEVFVDLGLAIKHASPFPVTLVIELCQDAPGYIPTKKAFAEGSYETVNSRIAPGGGEMMAEAAVRLLKQTLTDTE